MLTMFSTLANLHGQHKISAKRGTTITSYMLTKTVAVCVGNPPCSRARFSFPQTSQKHTKENIH